MIEYRIKPVSRKGENVTFLIARTIPNTLGSSQKLVERTFNMESFKRFMTKFTKFQAMQNRKKYNIDGKNGKYYLFTY